MRYHFLQVSVDNIELFHFLELCKFAYLVVAAMCGIWIFADVLSGQIDVVDSNNMLSEVCFILG